MWSSLRNQAPLFTELVFHRAPITSLSNSNKQWCTDMEILQSWSNPKLFHRLHIQSMDSDIQSKSETVQSIAH